MGASPTIRKALVADAPSIHKLINHFAHQNLMLARSLSELYDNIRDFLLCEDAGGIVACGAGHIVWEDLAEIRSLAVGRQYWGRGFGTSLVRALEEELSAVGVRKVFVLTFLPAFFEKLGYEQISKDRLPHKIWSECIKCPFFPDCNETALIKSISAPSAR